MAFFTRKGIIVPDLPTESVLTEEPEELCVSVEELSLVAAPCSAEIPNEACVEGAEASPESSAENDDEQKRFDYVVDRTYGVEV